MYCPPLQRNGISAPALVGTGVQFCSVRVCVGVCVGVCVCVCVCVCVADLQTSLMRSGDGDAAVGEASAVRGDLNLAAGILLDLIDLFSSSTNDCTAHQSTQPIRSQHQAQL